MLLFNSKSVSTLILADYFNTSNVTIQQELAQRGYTANRNFNTSNVTIQL